MATKTTPYLTAAEYLAFERESKERHEYFDGEVFAMSGASRRRNLIVFNLVGLLRDHLKRGPCEAYLNDMRVRIAPTGLYAYPDVIVVCDEPQFEDDHVDTLLNPTVLIEVLSKSTEGYDRGEKFEPYRKLPSLRAYIFFSQEAVHPERFVRQEAGRWEFTEATGTAASLPIDALGAALELAEVYDKVSFDDADA